MFERTEILFLLLLLGAFVLIYFMMLVWRRKALSRFASNNTIGDLMPDASGTKSLIKFILLSVAFASLVFALANPRSGSKLEKVKRKGVELMICLDVSNSMMAQDIKPNRLIRAKQAISKLIDKLENDKIGLVAFAGKSYLLLPLTPDYGAAKMYLADVSTQIVPVQGTAIGSAIETAVKGFNVKKRDSKNHRAIIVITDGENHEDDAVEAAKMAVDSGIVVHTIGMGLPDGSPIPVFNKSEELSGYKTDDQGNTIMSKLDETMLQKIAAAGNGIYVRANTTDVGLDKIMAEIDKMDKKEMESKVYSEYESHFVYFIAFALLILIIDIFVFERKTRWFANLNLFGEKKI